MPWFLIDFMGPTVLNEKLHLCFCAKQVRKKSVSDPPGGQFHGLGPQKCCFLDTARGNVRHAPFSRKVGVGRSQTPFMHVCKQY